MSIIASIVVSLVLAAVSLALSELLAPKPDLQNAKPAGAGDFDFPTAIEGRAIPVVYGTVQISGPNVVWYGDFRAEKIREKIKTSLFSSKKITVGFRYNVGLQLALCLGQIDKLTRIWVGDTVVATGTVQDGSYVVNLPKLFGGDKIGNGGMVGTFRVRSGSSAQTANSYLNSFQNPNIPNRGVCEVVWEGGYIGNTTNLKPWKFEVARFPNQLGLTGGKEIINSNDANPAAIIYELLTDTDFGFALLPGDIDTTNFTTVADTLVTEGNGFSMVLDRRIEAVELLNLVQEQIDGIVYLDPIDGKFKISLARDDYDIDLVPQLSEDTGIIEVKEFTRGTWEETKNQVRIGFIDRDRGYFRTFSQAHDLGNQQIQGNEIVSTEIDMPGIKSKDLANDTASRELRQLAIPLAKATMVVDRTYWDVKPNDVLAWTDDNLGFTKLPMRVTRIDYGELVKGEITLSLVQDTFKFTAGFFGEPDSTLWQPPAQEVEELDETLVIESPKAFTKRDPEDPLIEDRVWAGARRNTGNEVTFTIYQRNASGTPAGDYTEDSDEVLDFFLVGELRNNVSPAAQDGSETIAIDAVDSLADLADAFTSGAAGADIGANLVNLCYIDTPNGGEFFSPSSVTNQGTHLDLTSCWRGLLDTASGSHSSGTRVYLVFRGGDLNQSAIEQGNNVDVQLRANSFTDETTEVEADTVALTMNNRPQRPYPPANVELNTVVFPSSVDIDTLMSGGSGLDDRGIDFEWIRRDFETFSETEGITTDAETIDPDFPTKHTTQYDVDVTIDISSLEDNIEAFWRFEEVTGATREDETSNNVDLSDTGVVTTAAGLLGDSASMNGSTQYLESGSTGDFNLGANADFMFAGWFRLDNKSADQVLASKWQDGARRGWRVFYDQAADRFKFDVSDDGTTTGATATADEFGSPSTATWYFIVAEHDGVNDEIRISVNRGEKDVTAHSLGVNQALEEFRLGADTNGSDTATNFLAGDVDAAGVYSEILSDEQLGWLYNAGSGIEASFTTLSLHDPDWNGGTAGSFLSRTEIVRITDGNIPSEISFSINTRHTLNGNTRESLQTVDDTVSIGASDFDNDTWMATLSQNEVSREYTAPDTGSYDFEIGAALSTGDVEARINGGAWAAVISSGTTGTLAGVTASDTIEVRHTEPSVGSPTILTIAPPTSTAGAFGVLE